MLINSQIELEFLISKIGPYVEINSKTGNPKIIKGLNEVEDAIEQFGGVAKVAKHFSINEMDVEGWIDQHYIPHVIALEIAKVIGCKTSDFQCPSLGYENDVTGYCWPKTWASVQ